MPILFQGQDADQEEQGVCEGDEAGNWFGQNEARIGKDFERGLHLAFLGFSPEEGLNLSTVSERLKERVYTIT